MDVIQEFGYICAVEELNSAIESFEPATESAIDTIKNIAKKFWDFVRMICQKIISAIQTVIRKMKSNKRLSYKDRDKIDHFILHDIPNLVKICEYTQTQINKCERTYGADENKEIAHDLNAKLEDTDKIVRNIKERINTDSKDTDDLKEDFKTNIDDLIKPLLGYIDRFKDLEDKARTMSTRISALYTDKHAFYNDDEQLHVIRAYNFAQSIFNTSISGISAVIVFISKL